jgi:hypothetical protein
VSSEATEIGENPSGDRPPISSKRRGVPNPLGGGGRGPRGLIVCPIDGGGSHRRWPGSTGDGGGNIGRRRGSGERERRVSEEKVG